MFLYLILPFFFFFGLDKALFVNMGRCVQAWNWIFSVPRGVQVHRERDPEVISQGSLCLVPSARPCAQLLPLILPGAGAGCQASWLPQALPPSTRERHHQGILWKLELYLLQNLSIVCL